MEVSLKMNPALEIWFGEMDWIEWEEEDWSNWLVLFALDGFLVSGRFE